MTTIEISAALDVIRQEADLNAKALLLAGLVSELFRERGFEPVVVGGSAIEFYTDGAYMSGDTDICWTGWPQPTEEQKEEIMRQIPGVKCHGGAKSWCIEGLWVGAKKLMTAVLTGTLPIDWNEALRVAACSKYNCVAELKAVKAEVEEELANRDKQAKLRP